MNELKYSLVCVLMCFLIGCQGGNKPAPNSGDKTVGTQGQRDEKPRRNFGDVYVDFSLEEIEGLYYLPFDSLPWRGSIKQLPQNGELAYYFLDRTNDPSISSPHVRIEYVSRRMPFCSTIDSLYLWTENTFVKSSINGQIKRELEYVETQSGIKAGMWTIFTPPRKERPGPNDNVNPNIKVDEKKYREKWMNWGYVVQGDYMVGFVYTTRQQAHQEAGLEKFQALIQSFKSNK